MPLYLSSDQIATRVQALGADISREYAGQEIVCICILRGGFMFAAHLLNHLTIPHEIDFMTVSSYKHGTESGELKLVTDVDTTIHDRHVLIIEDIVDTGKTIDFVTQHLMTLGAASVQVATLLDKPERRKVLIQKPQYIGFTIPNIFVYGFGMDLAGKERGLSSIWIHES